MTLCGYALTYVAFVCYSCALDVQHIVQCNCRIFLSFASLLDSQRNQQSKPGAVDKRVESSGRKSDHAPRCSRPGLLAACPLPTLPSA